MPHSQSNPGGPRLTPERLTAPNRDNKTESQKNRKIPVMSADIERILQRLLSGATGLPAPGPLTCQPVGGGSINNTYQVLTKFNNRWFCKFNNTRHFPDLFEKENNGLSLFRRSPSPAASPKPSMKPATTTTLSPPTFASNGKYATSIPSSFTSTFFTPLRT